MILVLTVSTGCWDSKDIEEKHIITAVIVDKTDLGYAFYVEIASISQSKDTEGNEQRGSARKSIILRSEGATFTDAREDLERKSNVPIYLGADQCIVLTQKMADNGIEQYMYRLRQIPEYRKTVDVVVTSEKPEDLLNAKTQNDQQVGFSIEDTLQTLVDEGHCIHFSLAELLEALAAPNKCYFTPTIGLRDNEIALTGYSVFYGGICKGFIPAEEAEGLIIMRAENPRGTFDVPYMDNCFTVETYMTKRNINAVYENGQIIFNLEYGCDAMIQYLKKDMAVTYEVTREVRKELEKMLLKEIYDTIIKSKALGYDYLNFYNVFRIKYPDVAKSIDWLNEYPNAEFNIDIVVNLDTTGNLDYNPRIK